MTDSPRPIPLAIVNGNGICHATRSGFAEQKKKEEEEILFDPKSANVQCITYQIYN